MRPHTMHAVHLCNRAIVFILSLERGWLRPTVNLKVLLGRSLATCLVKLFDVILSLLSMRAHIENYRISPLFILWLNYNYYITYVYTYTFRNSPIVSVARAKLYNMYVYIYTTYTIYSPPTSLIMTVFLLSATRGVYTQTDRSSLVYT